MEETIKKIHKCQKDFEHDVSQTNEGEHFDLQKKYLGKKGVLTEIMRLLPSLGEADRKHAGILANSLKQEILTKTSVDRQNQQEIQPTEDWTLSGNKKKFGSTHPISMAIEELEHFFHGMGFSVFQDAQEIEHVFYNFDALNVPANHPARSRKDTFYVDEHTVLRTHTSDCQIRMFEKQTPPIRAIFSGAVYRMDADSTHTPMFHQIDGMWVDDEINFSNLLAVLEEFLRYYFGTGIEIRCRPSYFPFTEPSAEIDIRLPGKDWLEILGCGMIHDNVLRPFIKDKKYRGFAFGVGIERLLMIKYDISDIKVLFENDIRFLRSSIHLNKVL